ncbi:MAG: hypothetical protein M1274_02880, partial [Actinobacteria bacterium]|nr:hypothetical protein [Actinomycetota bacterium]
MAKLPVSLSKAMNAWKEVSSNAGQPASIVLAGDAGLVGIAQEKFSSGGTVPATWVGAVSELSGLSGVSGEILLVLVAADKEAETISALERAPSKGNVVLAVDGAAVTTDRFSHPWKGCIRV